MRSHIARVEASVQLLSQPCDSQVQVEEELPPRIPGMLEKPPCTPSYIGQLSIFKTAYIVWSL